MKAKVKISTVRAAINRWKKLESRTEEQEALILSLEDYREKTIGAEELKARYQEYRLKNPLGRSAEIISESSPTVEIDRAIVVKALARILASLHLGLYHSVSTTSELGSPLIDISEILAEIQGEDINHSNYILSGWTETAETLVPAKARISVKHAVWLDFTALSIEKMVQIMRGRVDERTRDLKSAVARGDIETAAEIIADMKSDEDADVEV